MRHATKSVLALAFAVSYAGCALAQNKRQVPDSDVVKRSIKAVGYEVGGGSTKVIFVGTPAAPNANGEAKVEAKKVATAIEVKFSGMPQPTTWGSEFLTYVLWAVTPDGATTNLGEIRIDKNGEGKLNTTAQSQTFAMGVTAEPYFAVPIPSEIVVLTNDTTKNTKGKIYPENSYKLMKRSQYQKLGNPLALTLDPQKRPARHVRGAQCSGHCKDSGCREVRPRDFRQSER
jgi:hypothetical protein